MIQGTMSNAGKSLLCAGLCRIFKQDGYRVAPFKSQNMALNSYITKDGLEMGRAQVMQAEAAGIEPEAAMNPILLKPTSNMGSQLIVNGEVRGNYPAAEYFKMKKSLIPDIMDAYNSLASRYDVIVVEGAGSPAEINLRENDIVNMGLAEMLDAPVLLAGDIDRGGVFAQLYGTAALLTEEERRRIRAFVINKFRGDKEILKPGLAMLYERIRIPFAGVIPYMDVDVDDEDSLSERLTGKHGSGPLLDRSGHEAFAKVTVVRLPRISNFTDFNSLERLPGIALSYVSRPEELTGSDLIIIPGTKNTMGDLKWLRQNGLETVITRMAGRTPVPEKESIESFAAHQATMVIFLSTGMLEELSKRLIEGGYQPETPAAIVYKATWPEEKTFVCTVGTLAETAKKNQITKTALMIIGNAVSQGNYRRSDLYNPAFTTEFREAEK